MKLSQHQLAIVLDEYSRRVAADPDSFAALFADDGQPHSDYGVSASGYCFEIAAELEAEGKLPLGAAE